MASKPGVPEFEDWDVDRVDLKWEPPKSTGGAPITGYIIEMKEKPSPNWQEATVTDSPQPKGRVTGLKKGSVYQFRVRAVNKAGQSEPSDPTKPHVAKARHRKCIVHCWDEVLVEENAFLFLKPRSKPRSIGINIKLKEFLITRVD